MSNENDGMTKIEKTIGTWGLNVIGYLIALFLAVVVVSPFGPSLIGSRHLAFFIVIFLAVFIRPFLVEFFRYIFRRIEKED